MFFVLVVLSCNHSKQGEIKVISSEEMYTFLQLDNVQLVDVRTEEEYQNEAIPKSQNINFLSPDFLEEFNRLDKEKPVFIYCGSGGRSAKCAEKLLEAGFIKIYDLKGGISKWKHDGYTVDTKL